MAQQDDKVSAARQLSLVSGHYRNWTRISVRWWCCGTSGLSYEEIVEIADCGGNGGPCTAREKLAVVLGQLDCPPCEGE